MREHRDYPTGVRFVPSEPTAAKIYTRDEFIFACWLSGFCGVLITVLGAYLWSFG